jgi:hypothetical protein
MLDIRVDYGAAMTVSGRVTCGLFVIVTRPASPDIGRSLLPISFGPWTPKLSLRDDIDIDVEGRDVLIVDDIIDTGRTLKELAGQVGARGPRSVATVALVSKTSRRSPDAEADHYGLEIGDEFIYGYGLDWDERFRDLPFIARAAP